MENNGIARQPVCLPLMRLIRFFWNDVPKVDVPRLRLWLGISFILSSCLCSTAPHNNHRRAWALSRSLSSTAGVQSSASRHMATCVFGVQAPTTLHRPRKRCCCSMEGILEWLAAIPAGEYTATLSERKRKRTEQTVRRSDSTRSLSPAKRPCVTDDVPGQHIDLQHP